MSSWRLIALRPTRESGSVAIARPRLRLLIHELAFMPSWRRYQYADP
jgi:hypothetical protein